MTRLHSLLSLAVFLLGVAALPAAPKKELLLVGVGPGAVAPDMEIGAFPAITRHVAGVRLLAVLGSDARPARRPVR